MKTRLRLVVIALCFVSMTAYADEIPKIVTSGLEAYKTTGFDGAFNIWLKGSPLESDKTTLMKLKGPFTQIESMYGKMIGYEVLRSIVISSSTTRIYAEIRYEKGPLFLFFDCYKSPDAWIIPMMKFHTELDQILPKTP